MCMMRLGDVNIKNDDDKAISDVFDCDPLTVVNRKLKHKGSAFGNR